MIDWRPLLVYIVYMWATAHGSSLKICYTDWCVSTTSSDSFQSFCIQVLELYWAVWRCRGCLVYLAPSICTSEWIVMIHLMIYTHPWSALPLFSFGPLDVLHGLQAAHTILTSSHRMSAFWKKEINYISNRCTNIFQMRYKFTLRSHMYKRLTIHAFMACWKSCLREEMVDWKWAEAI